MKKYLNIGIWVSLILATLILTGFINNSLKDEKCKAVLVQIQDQQELGFLNEGDISELLNREFNTPISQKIRDIDTYSIENLLNGHHAIENAEVYISIDGILSVQVKQRRPILRVFSGDHTFYIDDRGKIMPTSPKYTARVPIASGNINFDPKDIDLEKEGKEEALKLYSDLFKLAGFISEDAFWKAQIEQLYVNKDSEFELIPRVGNHTIVLGELNNLERKFKKLELFYKEGLSKTGWNEFKTINLKFENQVVCTKRY